MTNREIALSVAKSCPLLEPGAGPAQIKLLMDALETAIAAKLGTVSLTAREIDEMEFALYYTRKRSPTMQMGHGTDGHNRLVLIAKFANLLGMSLSGSVHLEGAEPYAPV